MTSRFLWLTKLIVWYTVYVDPNIQWWSKHRRGSVLPYHPREWQNDCVCRHWPCRISPVIPFNRVSPQHNSPCPSKHSHTNRFPCHTKMYVSFEYRQWVDLICIQADRKYDKDISFQRFKCQMYHNTIHAILRSLKPGMITPIVCCCPDGHFHWVIYDLAAYIADYPEQVYLAGIVQNWCLKYYCSSLYFE